MARAPNRPTRVLPKSERFTVFVMGGLFLTVGVIVPSLLLAKSIRGYLRTQAEVSVEAKIQNLEWIGGKGSHTRVEYRYRHAGEDYVGTETSLFGESDGLYGRLRAAHESGRPVRAWIDPDHPSFAVLERQLRWKNILLCLGLFGGFAAMGAHLIRCGRRGVSPNLDLY